MLATYTFTAKTTKRQESKNEHPRIGVIGLDGMRQGNGKRGDDSRDGSSNPAEDGTTEQFDDACERRLRKALAKGSKIVVTYLYVCMRHLSVDVYAS